MDKGRGVAGWACARMGRPTRPVGRGRGFPLFFVLLVSFFYLFSFSVFIYFKILRQFIKLCLLHHIDLCKIWHLPNTFVLNFEKLLLFALILKFEFERD